MGAPLAGFYFVHVHASLDGRHVLNYAQWRRKEDLEAFARDRNSERLGAAVRAVGPTSGPHAIEYRVIRSIEAPAQV